MFLVVSAGPNPAGKSRVPAHAAAARLRACGEAAEVLDLRDLGLPPCDGAGTHEHPDAVRAGEMIDAAAGVPVAAPVYDYDVNAACKNLVELAGRAWTGKAVGRVRRRRRTR